MVTYNPLLRRPTGLSEVIENPTRQDISDANRTYWERLTSVLKQGDAVQVVSQAHHACGKVGTVEHVADPTVLGKPAAEQVIWVRFQERVGGWKADGEDAPTVADGGRRYGRKVDAGAHLRNFRRKDLLTVDVPEGRTP